jgi:hypothetical protein
MRPGRVSPRIKEMKVSRYQIKDLPSGVAEKILINPESGCWEWQKWLDPKGYGHAQWNGRPYRAHRLVYELLVGEIPDGLQLDHVKARGCASKACCLPDHMEPVTGAENHRRRRASETHCPSGHEYSPENLYIEASGSRRCRACWRDYDRRRRGV